MAIDECKRLILAIADIQIGRNDPCYCGSGLKFKKCCGANHDCSN